MAAHTRIILVDGRSGSGKTTLARTLARRHSADIIHMDDLYPGWDGLAAGAAAAATIVERLATGKAVSWRTWDWHRSAWGPERSRLPGGTVILEGCGSLTAETAAYSAERYWLDADEETRRSRATERDEDDTWWDRWRAQEDRFYARHQPWRLATRRINSR